MHYVMEPDFRYGVSLLGPPGVISLGPSEDEAPVYGPDIVLFKYREVSNELGSCLASHVLSTNDWSLEGDHFVDEVQSTGYITICVKCNDIAFGEYVIVDVIVTNISVPKSGCQGLSWIGKSSPPKYLSKQRKAFLKVSRVPHFIIEIPECYPRLVFEF